MNITRRKFVKEIACAYCACLSLDYLKAAEENENRANKGKTHLAATCGTYCGACPAYIAKHGEKDQIKLRQQKRSSSEPEKAQAGIPPSNWMDGLLCDGCLSGGELAGHCQNCGIRKCAESKQNDSRCTHCEELPCTRMTNLINMGGYFHRKEYLPNLEKIRKMSVKEWIQYEEERWRCLRCGMPLSWYDTECVGCGAPRSERLFPL